MPNIGKPSKQQVTYRIYLPGDNCMSSTVNDAQNIYGIRQNLSRYLPAHVDHADVGIIPSNASQTNAPEYDVLVCPSMARVLNDNSALIREVQEERALHVLQLEELRQATAELRDARLHIRILEKDRLHRLQKVKPKAMIGVLGWMAKAYCHVARYQPVSTYATRIIAVLKAKHFPEKLGLDMDTLPFLSKYFTDNIVTKIDAAAVVSERDEDAHLENDSTMLLATLLDLEQGTVDSGMFGPGEESAELAAVRMMLAQLGNTEARRIVEVIKADPAKYGPIATGQEARFAKFL